MLETVLLLTKIWYICNVHWTIEAKVIILASAQWISYQWQNLNFKIMLENIIEGEIVLLKKKLKLFPGVFNRSPYYDTHDQ